MGKPFSTELKLLPSTYEWFLDFDISSLISTIRSSASFPLLVTGSGGSLTVATLAASLHQSLTGNLAKVVTPLELVSTLPFAHELSVAVISAGGKNPDILAALNQAIFREPRHLSVLCSSCFSPLGTQAKTYPYIDLFEFEHPAKRDGFLATNSLFAFCGLLIRAYHCAFEKQLFLPPTFEELAFAGKTEDAFAQMIQSQFQKVLSRNLFVVLFDETTKAAAFDLESKFTEAALGSIQLADYRNFAHGRHHWLAKHGEYTAVIAFISDTNHSLAKKTISILPKHVPTATITAPGNPTCAALSAIVQVFYITRLAGLIKKVDPGRPGVPAFGRRIYHLRGMPAPPNLPLEKIAVSRKARSEFQNIPISERVRWQASFVDFSKQIQDKTFGALALDYDGTVCDLNKRKDGILKLIAREFIRLLKHGIIIGIATGRGDSVQKDMRQAIPKQLWKQIIVGYHNGAEVGALGDADVPTTVSKAIPVLQKFCDELQTGSNRMLQQIAKWKFGRFQATAYPHPSTKLCLLWEIVMEKLQAHPELTAVRSCHSLDVLLKDTSKQAVVNNLRNILTGDLEILCIGDSGQWPGNDHALLGGPLSLSVHEGSLDPVACWNLAPQGFRGTMATLFYLRCLKIKNGAMTLKLP